MQQKSSTSPSYYEGSKRGYYTGGSFSARWANTDDHLFTASLPKLKSGCGGIDMFLGGFSFLNVDYLVQKLQNILSAAPAAAFDIALKTLAPQVADTIKTLEAITDRLNSLQLNDCKAAKALVATAASPFSSVMSDSLKAEMKTAQTDFMVSSGAKDLYQDVSKLFESEQKANAGNKPGVPGTTQTSATSATAGCPAEVLQIFGDGSVLENLASKKGMNSDYVKLVRGFIGDVVIQSPATTGTTYQAQYVPPCDKNNSFDSFISGSAQGRDTAGACADITATVTNGMAKSVYNILWGLNPKQMRDSGWEMKSATDFQTKYGAFKEVRKTDEKNRHRESERVTTYDTAGISPAALIYTLPNFVNVDSDDFDDLPPVEREVIKCPSHALVETCHRSIENIIEKADLPPEDLLAAAAVRNAAFLRVSDTFRHYNDELKLRDVPLGTLHRLSLPDGELLLEKEEKLIAIAQGVIDQGERLLVYTGNTQKIDMRPVLKRILRDNVQGASIVILPDSVAPEKLVGWFEQVTAQVVVVSFHRVATGLNLSQFNNLVWYDYTSNTRLAEQGDGRIRRVNTADIHRAQFGEVRPVRYWYLTSSEVQALQLAYTLEKRMVAKLAEGETPDIDPAECSSSQSFSSLMTKALKEGNFNYSDPSALLKKMTQHENARVRGDNKAASPVRNNVIQLPVTRPEPVPVPSSIAVIHCEGGKEITRELPLGTYQTLLDTGALEFTLFGVYLRQPAPLRKRA